MIFEPPNLEERDLDVIEQIEVLRKRLRHVLGTSPPARWQGNLRRATLARNIRHSNSIEGINVTRDDAMAAVENDEPLQADKPTWEAVRGYRDAMTYVLQLASAEDFRYDENLIRSLHFMIAQYDLTKHPGRWRPGMVFVRDERRQAVVYEAPDASLVPGLMAELVQSLNQLDDTPLMVRAAMGHLNLVMIHPFSDGNGRMARCLQTLILARQQFVEPPFCSIEEYLGRFTQEYYDVLAQVGQGSWHPGNDCHPWLRFNLVAHYRQGTWLLQRTRITQRVWDEIEGIAGKMGLPERSTPSLADAAFGYRVRNSTYRISADVSLLVATRDLKRLVEAGLLVGAGERRARVYAASARLREIYLKSYEPRTEEDPYSKPITPRQPGFSFPA